MTELSPAASAVWEAFNQDEAGVFVDYGDKLAAALRAAADLFKMEKPLGDTDADAGVFAAHQAIRHGFLAIAAELEGTQ
jgi:hypothetical protein